MASVTVMLAIGLPAAWKTGLLVHFRKAARPPPVTQISARPGNRPRWRTSSTFFAAVLLGLKVLTQSYTGLVTARRATTLATKTLGRIEHISVDLGDPVVQGQVLISLDARELSAQQQVLTSDLHAAEAKLRELEAGPRPGNRSGRSARVAELMASLRLAEGQLWPHARTVSSGGRFHTRSRRKSISPGLRQCATRLSSRRT